MKCDARGVIQHCLAIRVGISRTHGKYVFIKLSAASVGVPSAVGTGGCSEHGQIESLESFHIIG
jgi:hypothetical protein